MQTAYSKQFYSGDWASVATQQAKRVFENTGLTEPVSSTYFPSQMIPGITVESALSENYTTSYAGDENGRSQEEIVADLVDTDDGRADDVSDPRDSTNADVVILLIRDPAYEWCGLARSVNAGFNPDDAYAVVDTRCIFGYTPTHELGHTIGLAHNYREDPNQYYSLDNTNHGHLNLDFDHRTVTSYDLNRCCDRKAYCSTTKKDYPGYGQLGFVTVSEFCDDDYGICAPTKKTGANIGPFLRKVAPTITTYR